MPRDFHGADACLPDGNLLLHVHSVMDRFVVVDTVFQVLEDSMHVRSSERFPRPGDRVQVRIVTDGLQASSFATFFVWGEVCRV